MRRIKVYTQDYELLGSEGDESWERKGEADSCLELCEPEKAELYDGLTAADIAVAFLRKEGIINPSTYPEWGGRHTWYSDEPYENPYTGVRTERTAHLDGEWSDDEMRAIYASLHLRG